MPGGTFSGLMNVPTHLRARRSVVIGLVALACPLGTAAASPAGGGGLGISVASATSPSGGAPIGGLAPTHKPHRVPRAPGKNVRGKWLSHFTVTEYWPAPEAWFVGRLVKAPGLAGEHRIDWLYSATGLSMEGEGIGLDGRVYHIDALGKGGWVTAAGVPTSPSDGWSSGSPYWRAGGYWKDRSGSVTFPLARGGWSAGSGQQYLPLAGVTFASGPSIPLRFYQSIAVDPKVIPLGSRVYIPGYRRDGHGGWFLAQDTGGAINGRHVDVYRPPPSTQSYSGGYLSSQRVFVVAARK